MISASNPRVVMFLIAIISCAILVQAQDISVPPPSVEYMRVEGPGVNTYECRNGTYLFTYGTGEMQNLKDPTIKLGYFSNYPIPSSNLVGATFQFGGNSTAGLFQLKSSNASRNPNSLYDALFICTVPGTGELSRATYFQRLDTLSGLAPDPTCTTEGLVHQVIFRAEYAFFRNP